MDWANQKQNPAIKRNEVIIHISNEPFIYCKEQQKGMVSVYVLWKSERIR